MNRVAVGLLGVAILFGVRFLSVSRSHPARRGRP